MDTPAYASHGRCPFPQTTRHWNFIVDFCAPRKKLIIELDGSEHIDQQEYDLERTKFLKSKGYKVLRFWNSDVLNKIDHVLKAIWQELEK